MVPRRARRLAALLAVTLSVTAMTFAGHTGVASTPELDASVVPALRDVAPWPVGVAIDEREMTGPGRVAVTRHFDQITAENAMKPAYIWRDPARTDWREWDWSRADAYVDFALAHGLRVYGHTLVWHQQMPDWFYRRDDGTPYWNATQRRCADVTEADRDLMRGRITTYIGGVAAHFRTRYGDFGSPTNPIVAFDVVNEAIDSTDDHFRQVENPLYCVLGTTYLEHALRTADKAFRNADGTRTLQLFINDFNTEWSWKSDDQLAVVRDLVQRGVPLDGVGHQLHLSLNDRATLLQDSNLRRTLAQIDALGLRQAVTELDVGMPINLSGTALEQGLAEQGDYYADLFTLFRRYDLFSVSVWGPHDGRTWRTGARPLLFTADYQAKPAFLGASERPPTLTKDLPAHLSAVEGETVEIAVEVDAHPVATVTWEVRPAGSSTWSSAATGDSASYRFTAAAEDTGSALRAVVRNRRGTSVSSILQLAVTERRRLQALLPPRITGTAVVGRTLRVDSGSWEPSPSRLSYQWLRDGRPIPSATRATYVAGAADMTARLSARVTAEAPGLDAVAVGTTPTAPIARATSDLRVRVQPSTRRRWVVLTIQVSAEGVVPTGGGTILHRGRVLRRYRLQDGRARVVLPASSVRRRSLVVHYSGAPWMHPASRSVRSR